MQYHYHVSLCDVASTGTLTVTPKLMSNHIGAYMYKYNVEPELRKEEVPILQVIMPATAMLVSNH